MKENYEPRAKNSNKQAKKQNRIFLELTRKNL